MSRKEAQTAAAYLGASWYDSIANDLEVTYDLDLVRKVAAVIRQVAPDIILIPALLDYMEDHMNTARIVVTAAFTKGMPNFHTIPQVDPIQKEIALYHALPYGLHDGLSRKVEAQLYTDISSVIDQKREMLALHTSQRNWLDDSQKLDSYVQTMRNMSEQVGRDSGQFSFAEGWIRHNPLGYSAPDFKPLEQILHASVLVAKPLFKPIEGFLLHRHVEAVGAFMVGKREGISLPYFRIGSFQDNFSSFYLI